MCKLAAEPDGFQEDYTASSEHFLPFSAQSKRAKQGFQFTCT